MFTPTSDYNQQLLGYLQTWRQLLEQWTAMTAGLPFPTAPFAVPTAPFMPPGGQFMPPFMPPMPPAPGPAVPPAPPAPADYTQQLFGYLQAWRQYLEQMTGASPGSPPTAQPPTAQPPTAAQPTGAAESQPPNHGGNAGPPHPPDVPIPPGDDTGSKTVPGSNVPKESNPTWPPPLLDIQPSSYGGSQVVSIGFDPASPYGPFGHGPGEPEVLNPPDYDFGYQFDGPRRRTAAGPAVASVGPAHMTEEAIQLPIMGTPFRTAIERAQAASAKISEVRETPSP